MKKAVIRSGNKQYLVAEGDEIKVELLSQAADQPEFEALLIIDGDNVAIGRPFVDKAKVTAEVLVADEKADKVTAIRYKAKKRVRKVHGHRQHQTVLKIKKISTTQKAAPA